jgi:hypothetical protein
MTTTITAVNACGATISLDNSTGTLVEISGSCVNNSVTLTSELGSFHVFGDRWTYRLVCSQSWELKIEALYTTTASEGLDLLRDWWFDSTRYALARSVQFTIGGDTYNAEAMLEQLDFSYPAGEAGPARCVALLRGTGAITYTTLTPVMMAYAATVAGGIYYSEDFSTTVMPTYAAINTGLLSLNMWMMNVDKNDPVNYQYAIDTSWNVYRRVNRGNWEVIMTNAAAAALTGTVPAAGVGYYGIYWLTTKAGAPGEVYLTYNTPITINGIWMLKSLDYGNSWAGTKVYAPIKNYDVGTIDVVGDVIHIAANVDTGAVNSGIVSVNGGLNFTVYNYGSTSNRPCVIMDPNNSAISWKGLDNLNINLYQSINWGATYTPPAQSAGLGFWLDNYPRLYIKTGNSNTQVLLDSDILYQTPDSWATKVTPALTGKTIVGFRYDEPTSLIFGWRNTLAGTGPTDKATVFKTPDYGATMTAWAGPDPVGGGDSIPSTVVGITRNGFHIVRGSI